MARIDLIIPCFNEASTIERNVERLIEEMQVLHHSFIIILVDDGSKDGTGIRLSMLQKKHPHLIVHPEDSTSEWAQLTLLPDFIYEALLDYRILLGKICKVQIETTNG